MSGFCAVKAWRTAAVMGSRSRLGRRSLASGAIPSNVRFAGGGSRLRDGTFLRTSATASAEGNEPCSFRNLRLHLYDHCPYCTRVELVLGWRGMPYERRVYGYADVDGPTRLTGKKVLPVLEWQDEVGKQRLMPESVDIIEALDTCTGPDNRVVSQKTGRKDLRSWQKRFRRIIHHLTRPRLIGMPIADFATQEDAQYQMNKYIARGFDYEEAMASTDSLIRQMEIVLQDFDPLLSGERSLNEVGWSWDDLHMLPSFRVLSCVKGLKWPDKTLRYVTEAHVAAGVSLYFEHAV